MKKSILFLVCFLFVLGSLVTAGEMTFDQFKKLVAKDVVPEGFILDETRSFDMKTTFHVEFKGDKEKGEKIIIALHIGKEEFSKMDKLRKPEFYKYKDRPALFSDGKKVGMGSFILILKNKKGKLKIGHRVFGGIFLNKADFEKIVEKIGLENLEK